ncbi:hypothetical protein Nepgr_027420 [Nepenthes gracilis]|uniref:Uncharacterized protein n=1 Tax=Nepenthes gracilis TaxID=150966 RepID=A0AAD3TBQ2_NEPGR|nr:hypothetical protein Nepgr_027420 [Nepenthes gracilis]
MEDQNDDQHSHGPEAEKPRTVNVGVDRPGGQLTYRRSTQTFRFCALGSKRHFYCNGPGPFRPTNHQKANNDFSGILHDPNWHQKGY